MLTICAVLIGVTVYQLCNYNAVNHQLLLQIQKQDMEVIDCLEKIRNTDNDSHQKVILENRLVEVSHVSLLKPAKLTEEISVLPRIKLHRKAKPASPTSLLSANTDK
jgi:hypothetical protein